MDGKKQHTVRDAVITVLFISFILYSLGLLDWIFEPTLENKLKDVQIQDRYIYVKPAAVATLKAKGDLSVDVVNMGTQSVEVKQAVFENQKSGACTLDRFVPTKLTPAEKLTIRAKNCTQKDAQAGKTYKVFMELRLKSTKKAYAEELARLQGLKVTENMKIRIQSMPKASEEVEYVSKGTLIGIIQ